jgi:5-methylcytosine-specific restriction endonuclease McrA
MATACFCVLFPPLLDISSLIFLLIVFFDEPLESGMARNPGSNIACAACQKEFYVPHNRKHTAKYCSKQCAGVGQMSRGVKACEECGVEFEFISTRANTAKYCSRKCYYKSLKGKGSVKYTCRHCGEYFFDAPSRNRKYCSRSCINKSSKKTFKPKYTTVRKAMISRDLIKSCNRCGYSEHPEILGVHHKDRNRKNNDISNLEVLCPNCHSLEHSKHIAHNGHHS